MLFDNGFQVYNRAFAIFWDGLVMLRFAAVVLLGVGLLVNAAPAHAEIFKFVFGVKDNYKGQKRKGKPHGKGKYTNDHGDTYEGQFRNGLPHGKGKYVWRNGDTYEGQVQNNIKHGKGVYTMADGSSYNGDWKQDRRHGKGTYVFPDQARYQGAWVNDVMQGKGTYTFPTGMVYRGDFADNQFHGKGIMSTADGITVHDGEWQESNPVGQHQGSALPASGENKGTRSPFALWFPIVRQP